MQKPPATPRQVFWRSSRLKIALIALFIATVSLSVRPGLRVQAIQSILPVSPVMLQRQLVKQLQRDLPYSARGLVKLHVTKRFSHDTELDELIQDSAEIMHRGKLYNKALADVYIEDKSHNQCETPSDKTDSVELVKCGIEKYRNGPESHRVNALGFVANVIHSAQARVGPTVSFFPKPKFSETRLISRDRLEASLAEVDCQISAEQLMWLVIYAIIESKQSLKRRPSLQLLLESYEPEWAQLASQNHQSLDTALAPIYLVDDLRFLNLRSIMTRDSLRILLKSDDGELYNTALVWLQFHNPELVNSLTRSESGLLDSTQIGKSGLQRFALPYLVKLGKSQRTEVMSLLQASVDRTKDDWDEDADDFASGIDDSELKRESGALRRAQMTFIEFLDSLEFAESGLGSQSMVKLLALSKETGPFIKEFSRFIDTTMVTEGFYQSAFEEIMQRYSANKISEKTAIQTIKAIFPAQFSMQSIGIDGPKDFSLQTSHKNGLDSFNTQWKQLKPIAEKRAIVNNLLSQSVNSAEFFKLSAVNSELTSAQRKRLDKAEDYWNSVDQALRRQYAKWKSTMPIEAVALFKQRFNFDQDLKLRSADRVAQDLTQSIRVRYWSEIKVQHQLALLSQLNSDLAVSWVLSHRRKLDFRRSSNVRAGGAFRPDISPKSRLQDAIAENTRLATCLRCSTYRGYVCAAHLRLKPCIHYTCAFRSLFC